MKTQTKKPKVKLVGENGNVFNLLAICTRALKNERMNKEADELSKKVFSCGSYDEALVLMSEYCEVH
jgi:hypothetical protein